MYQLKMYDCETCEQANFYTVPVTVKYCKSVVISSYVSAYCITAMFVRKCFLEFAMTSASFLAELSVRSPQKLFIFII